MENITIWEEGSFYTADSEPGEVTLSPYFIGTIPPLSATVMMAVIEVFGLFGNLLIAKVYLTSKHMRTPSNMFIVNLAVGDFVFLLTCNSTLNTMVKKGRMLYGTTGCTAVALIIVTMSCVTLMTMGLIAISRFIAIVHPQKKNLLSWGVCCTLSIAMWLYGAILMMPVSTGWGRIGYHQAGWACIFDWSYNFVYNLLIFAATQLLTSVVMVYCYAKIYWVFRQCKKRVAGEKSKEKGPKKEEIRLALQLLVVFAIYNICWAPYFLVALIIDPNGELPPWVYGAFNCFILWNSSVNVLIYYYYNKVFRAEVLKTFGFKLTDEGASSSSQNTASVTTGNN